MELSHIVLSMVGTPGNVPCAACLALPGGPKGRFSYIHKLV